MIDLAQRTVPAVVNRGASSWPGQLAVVDDAFARTFFPGENPLGKRFGLSLSGHGYDYEVVGVVRNTMYQSPTSTQMPMYFLPYMFFS